MWEHKTQAILIFEEVAVLYSQIKCLGFFYIFACMRDLFLYKNLVLEKVELSMWEKLIANYILKKTQTKTKIERKQCSFVASVIALCFRKRKKNQSKQTKSLPKYI